MAGSHLPFPTVSHQAPFTPVKAQLRATSRTGCAFMVLGSCWCHPLRLGACFFPISQPATGLLIYTGLSRSNFKFPSRKVHKLLPRTSDAHHPALRDVICQGPVSVPLPRGKRHGKVSMQSFPMHFYYVSTNNISYFMWFYIVHHCINLPTSFGEPFANTWWGTSTRNSTYNCRDKERSHLWRKHVQRQSI